MQELCDTVWADDRFQTMSKVLELNWIRKDLGFLDSPQDASLDASKLIRAAAILACSDNPMHRRAAFRVATSTYGIFGAEKLPLNQALRVVLARLGNFPSFATRPDVENSLSDLPLALAHEEMASAEKRSIQVNGSSVYLTDFQYGLWDGLKKKASIALSAPTSAGKSFVLQNHLVSLFNQKNSLIVAYVVPTRALISQVCLDLGEMLHTSNTRPEVISIPIDAEGDLPLRAIYVMTQERLQLMLGSHGAFMANVVVVDEAHSIGEGSRGVLLQWVIDDLLARNLKTQFLFASPAVRNLNIFGQLFGLPSLTELKSSEPTVAQNFLIVKIKSATKGSISISTAGDGSATPTQIENLTINRTIASRIDKLVQISAHLGAGSSNIVYANGAADAEKIALQLMDIFSSRATTTAQEELADLAKEAVHPNYVLVECVKRGIAFHYSNIPTQLRLAIEDAVSNGVLDYLVCTSTLLQGVNLPAKNLFMCSPEKGRAHPLQSIDFWNLSGRAGRLRREFQGNIFLIDYEKWKEKPLEGARDAIVVPAIEQAINTRTSELISIIRDDAFKDQKQTHDLDSTFVRLFTDYKNGNLEATLGRISIDASNAGHSNLMNALIHADTNVSLPTSIIRLNPGVSAHKQQNLFNYFCDQIAISEESASALIPLHPRENDAYDSYAEVLRICYQFILHHSADNKIHKFHAVIALQWIRGIPLPRLIEFQIKKKPDIDRRRVIREMLEVIEKDIRFQAVRLLGCYNTLLSHALREADQLELSEGIPQLPLYLELGASDRTMISFISLGLSRVTAMKLNEIAGRKDMDISEVKAWLAQRSPESLGLSPLLLSEIKMLLS
ncbi:DEAD/DEAH box helicase [Variovorax sp. W2I14]|uniref:DEAD/DEAH box helicase n=1 Tax=Variovorax sp. W2I14 TaxID=3042290 RepID=UPI003D2330AE